jgi:hypothetical protein
MTKAIFDALQDPIIQLVLGFQFCWVIFAIYQLWKVSDPIRRQTVNYYAFESIPGTFVTIGLFGTCLGIAFGLMHFNTDQDSIRESVKVLLRGLKSAFFTTIVGLGLSLVFRSINNYFLNKYKEIQPPESPELTQLKLMNDNLQRLGDNISSSFKDKLDTFLRNLQYSFNSLSSKLQSFGDDLAQQNQQALVTALEDTIKELNTGFKEVLSELVRQNFQALTESVQNLNSWQQKNKQQVEHFTSLFQKLVTTTGDFDGKLASLLQRNEKLVEQSVRIDEILHSMSQVFVNDERFVKIVTNLSESSENISKATDQFEKHAEELSGLKREITDWFSKQGGLKADIIQLNNQLADLQPVSLDNINGLKEEMTKILGTLDQILAAYHKAIVTHIDKKLNELNEQTAI